MRKSIFLLAVSAIALTACTQSEVVEEGVQSNAIGFQSTVGKNTRATELTQTDLNKFYVYSYYTLEGKEANPVNVFDGEQVTLSGDDWNYINTRYWVPKATYYFYAYSCGNNKMNDATGVPGMDLSSTGDDGRALKISDYICNNDHQHDLIFATNDDGTIKGEEKATPTKNKKVGFSFNHILTKVNAVFTSDFAPEYNIEISNVKIEYIRDKGDYNPKADTPWSQVERSGVNPYVELALTSPNNVASKGENGAVGETAETESAFVIPWSYGEADVRLTFKIDVKQGNDTFLSRNITGTWKPDWKPGIWYTYNITITGSTANLEPIVFETAENMNLPIFTPGTAPDITFSAN